MLLTAASARLDVLGNAKLPDLEALLWEARERLPTWFAAQWEHTPAPLYASVDLRHAGFKLAPVDTNLFPAGFNNLHPSCHERAVAAMHKAITRTCPTASQVLVVPENHTRNTYYLENLAALLMLIRDAGFSARIGSMLPDLDAPRPLTLPSGREVLLEPLRREGDRLVLDDYQPCLVMLNNDLSQGLPPILQDLDQPVLPPSSLGWTRRTKSGHFLHYAEVAKEFADWLGIDSWLIDPLSANCGQVNFQKREGLECAASNAARLLEEVAARYEAHGIDDVRPFVMVKADAGTYGMGVMRVHEAEEVFQINRKQRNKMASAKEGLEVTRVIIQEGVPTALRWGPSGAAAEPVIYMIDEDVVGSFYRIHEGRGSDENLNAPGMTFEPIACQTQSEADERRRHAYEVIARLALLAAAREVAAAGTEPVA